MPQNSRFSASFNGQRGDWERLWSETQRAAWARPIAAYLMELAITFSAIRLA
jgi:hypothetical protein